MRKERDHVVSAQALTFAQHLLTCAMLIAFILFIYRRLEWLAIRPLLFIGGISYPLYLLHQYLGVSLIPYLTAFHVPDLLAFGAVAVLCCAMAYAITRWIEIPAKRLILRLAHRHFFPRLVNVFPSLDFGGFAYSRTRAS